MDLFELQAKITLDTSEYEQGLDSSKKSMSEYKRDVMKLANVYKQQGMNMSDAMKRAYSEIDKSQYKTAESAEKESKRFFKSWDDAAEKTKGLGSKIAGAAKVIGAGVATVAGATASAVTLITKGAVDSYANYEQLVGGVQKLYGNMGQSVEEYAKSQGKSVDAVKGEWQKLEDAQNLVMKNAEQAYKTSGMNMNDYMETATSFSAALINSLGGDTKKAAEQTDVAMRAISDNVNTFGSDMESVQNAFQGFAKQNYTMLDNLKLGYGGTKEGMEQLIKDANEYGKSVGKASDLSIDSFSDIVTAIELVQEKQNIAGTTAREAATTLEGSLTMTKAAWQNVLTALGTGDLDKLTEHVQALGDSAATYIDNLIPVIENIFSSLPDALEPIIDKIGDKLPELIDKIVPAFIQLVGSLGSIVADAVPQLVEILVENLPLLIDAGVEIVTALISGIGEAMPDLIPAAIDAVLTIVQGLLENLPLIIEAGLQLIGGLVLGLAQAIPQLLAAAPELISTLVEGLLQSIDLLISAAGELITSLVNGLVENLPMIIDSAFEIISALVEGITQNLPTIIETAIQLIVTLIEGLTQALPQIIAYMPYIIDAIVNGLVNNFGMIIDCALQIVLTLVDAIANNLPKILEMGVELLEKLVSGILKFIKKMPETAKKLISSFKKAFTDIEWKDIGTHILEGIANGLSKGARIIIDAAKNAAAQAFNAVCDFLGIASPSKLFRDQVGKNMALGLGEGFEDYMPYDEIEDALSFDYNVPQFETEMSVSKVGTEDVAYGAGDNITINVYATERQDERRVAEEVQKQFVLWERQRKAVFA